MHVDTCRLFKHYTSIFWTLIDGRHFYIWLVWLVGSYFVVQKTLDRFIVHWRELEILEEPHRANAWWDTFDLQFTVFQSDSHGCLLPRHSVSIQQHSALFKAIYCNRCYLYRMRAEGLPCCSMECWSIPIPTFHLLINQSMTVWFLSYATSALPLMQ